MQPAELKLFETLPDNYLVVSPTLSILGASHAYLQITGKQHAAITGRPIFDVFPETVSEESEKDSTMSGSLKQVLLTGKPHELPIARIDIPDAANPDLLNERYWKTLNTPVVNDDGEVVYIIHRTEDVTERLLKEKELENSLLRERGATAKARVLAEQLEQLFHDIPAQIAIVRGPDLIYDYANPQYHRELFPGRDVIGLPLLAALPEVEGQPIWDILQWVFNSGQPFIENELLIPLAQYTGGPLNDHYFNTVYQPLQDEHGDTYAVLSFKYEVTGHVAARKQLEASEAKLLAVNDSLNLAVKDLQAIHEELRAANEEMTATNEELLETQDRLNRLNEQLETRVAERTMELAESVVEQQALNEEITATNEELASANEELLATNDELNNTQRRLEKTLIGLAESDQRFRNLIKSSGTGIILLTGPEMKVEIVNDAYGQLISRTPEELQGRMLFDVIPDAESYFRPIIESVLKNGKPVYLYDTPYLVHKDDIPIEGYLNVIYQPYREAEGEITGVMALCQDVTEQIYARKMLEESEKQFRFMLNAIPQQVWTATPDGALNYVNKVVADDFGYDQDAIIGHGWQKFIHPEDLPICLEKWIDSLRTYREYVVEFRLLFQNGSYVWHLARALPFIENGEAKLWLGTNTNIDLQKENERRKDEFLSVASHELKTPVTSLKASLQMLDRIKNNPSPVMLPKLIDQSNKSVDKITSLIDELLNSSVLNEGQLKLSKTAFSVHGMLEGCCNHVRVAGKHELIFEGNPNLSVFADERRIEQVVTNFVNNAVKYAPDSKTIYLIVEKDADMVKVAVKDNGPGIAADKIPHLFSRYYRADYSGSSYSGLGLGLYISAEIIKRHNGTIGVDSELGKGSSFWFRIPVE